MDQSDWKNAKVCRMDDGDDDTLLYKEDLCSEPCRYEVVMYVMIQPVAGHPDNGEPWNWFREAFGGLEKAAYVGKLLKAATMPENQPFPEKPQGELHRMKSHHNLGKSYPPI